MKQALVAVDYQSTRRSGSKKRRILATCCPHNASILAHCQQTLGLVTACFAELLTSSERN